MTTCPACGGALHHARVPGRTRKYHGQVYEIPESFPILTCSTCASEWMTSIEVMSLNAVFEKLRLRTGPTMDGDDSD
jgi:hypothetical protein